MNAEPSRLNSIREEVVHLMPVTNAAIRQLIQNIKELRTQVAGIVNRDYASTQAAVSIFTITRLRQRMVEHLTTYVISASPP